MKTVVTHELTLPQKIYPALDRLFGVFCRETRKTLASLWNEETLGLLNTSGSAMGVLKEVVPRPPYLPSRVHRNILEMTGEILRSQIKRKKVYEYLADAPCRVLYDEFVLARKLDVPPLLIGNAKKEVMRLLQKGRFTRDYFSVVKPSFSGNVVITSADDSLIQGQFRKLRIRGNVLEFELKVPDRGRWQWIGVKKFLPRRLRRDLSRTTRIMAPLIKRVFLKSGFRTYRLVVPLELEVEKPSWATKVLALDLSPSERRLAVGTVVSKEGHSSPVFFRAERMTRKLERLLKEISFLERKIDRIADQIHETRSREHKKALWERLKWLYAEQRLKWRKFKELRKQVLEVFVDLVLEHAVAYRCDGIAIEKLRFNRLPDWRSKKMRRLFSQWCYLRFKERLEHKAVRRGLRVIEVRAWNTTRTCHVCGERGEAVGLWFKCRCGVFDRDYNAAVNIGKRALGMETGSSKSQAQGVRDIPGRSPFRRGTVRLKFRALLAVLSLARLISYLHLVETSHLKLKSLIRYANKDECG